MILYCLDEEAKLRKQLALTKYGWRKGFEPDNCGHPSLVYDTFCAPNLPYATYIHNQIDPYLVEYFGSEPKAAEAAVTGCPLLFKTILEESMRELAGKLGIVLCVDLKRLGRHFAWSMRERVTPLLYYCWLFHSRSLAFKISGVQRSKKPNKQR